MNLVYIHGNHATADSFNFIRSKLPGHNDILLEYELTQDGMTLEVRDGLRHVGSVPLT